MGEREGDDNMDGLVPLIQGHFPGTQVAVEITARTSTVPATAVDRVKAAAAYKTCRRCEEDGIAGERNKIVAAPHYPTDARWVVVTPPGFTEQGWNIARAAGVIGDRTAVVPRLGCGLIGRDRANAGEVERCYGNVADAIWAAGCDYVVLIGRDACEMWRSDLTVEQMDGTIGVLWDRYVVMGLRDMSWIAKTPNRVERKTLARGLEQNVARWVEAVGEREGRLLSTWAAPALPVTRYMATSCVKCGDGTRWIDRDGIGWCGTCRNNGWMKARGLPASHGVQEVMF